MLRNVNPECGLTIYVWSRQIVCCILHLTPFTSIFQHPVNMDCIKNCNYHVLAPRTIQMSALNLSDLKGPGSAEPGFVRVELSSNSFSFFFLICGIVSVLALAEQEPSVLFTPQSVSWMARGILVRMHGMRITIVTHLFPLRKYIIRYVSFRKTVSVFTTLSRCGRTVSTLCHSLIPAQEMSLKIHLLRRTVSHGSH